LNPILKLGAESISLEWLLGFMTVFFLATFLAWVWWAYTPKHKKMMDEAAMLPFTDGDET
jgi:cbb3-type cytochrome oxidase subunit 3